MENEKYGIELTAETSYFKRAIKDAGQFVKAFGKGVKESFNDQVQRAFKEDFVFNDRDYQKRIDYIKDEMDAVNDQINAIKLGGKEGNLSELEKEYDRLTNKLEQLTNYQKQYNGELKETENTSNKTTISLGGLFDRSISKIKRFTFYLLGARSVFSMFMKYQGIYYQYNEQMRYQSELSQNAIALSLAPAFEFLGNVIAYTSIAFAKFIELLTGVPILSKVSTKGIRDYNKSLKESQSLLSGIDEITNLTLPSSTGLASQYQALNDFQKKVKEVEKFFAENKWIQELASVLQTIWDWLGKIIEKVGGVKNALILLGGAKVITSIGKLIGKAGTGLIPGSGLLGILAVCTGISLALLEISREKLSRPFEDNLKNLNDYADKFHKNMTSTEYKKVLSDINDELLSVQTKIQSQPEEYSQVKDELDKVLNKLTDITGIDYTIELKTDPKEEEGFFNGIKTGFNTMIEGFKNALGVGEMDKSWEHFSTKGKEAVSKIDSELGLLIKSINNGATTMSNEINKTLGKVIDKRTIEIGLKYNIPKSQVQSLITKVRAISVNLMGVPESTFNKIANSVLKKFGYKKGLDYVPYDNYLAVLHKGEAVVPAKYNTTIHSVGNEYTNSLLETLVMKIDDLANRPNVFEIDGQKFANATYSLYDNARSRQNYVEGVVR